MRYNIPMIFKDVFIRNIEAVSYRENFLVSAIVSIFVIRTYLHFAHYPKIGAGEFHIAHLLWGGFFMMAALLILLSFLNEKAAVISSIVGGVGFGTFIDELGKFITSDNNYFFQPTIALIYMLFVLLFLAFRALEQRQRFTPQERLANALDLVRDVALRQATPADRALADELVQDTSIP